MNKPFFQKKVYNTNNITKGGFYYIMVMVRGWGVAGHCGAFTGIHNIPDQISE